MGFWKKLGGFLGRTAITAAAGALEAKASGKPITIGTVGPGVLGDVLRRSEETVEAQAPPPIAMGFERIKRWPALNMANIFAVYNPTADNLWFCSDFKKTQEFALEVEGEIFQSVKTAQGIYVWVPMENGQALTTPPPPR
jgi:hypothetical protein